MLLALKQEVIELIVSLSEAANHVERAILRGKIMYRALDLNLKEGDNVDNQLERLRVVKAVKVFCSEPSAETVSDLKKLIRDIEDKFS